MFGITRVQFTDPQYLWLLALFVIFAAFPFVRIRFREKKLSRTKAFYEQFLIIKKDLLRSYVKESLIIGLVFATGVILLSGFKYETSEPQFIKENIAIIWILDASASGRAEEGHFGPGGRISAGKKEIRAFLAPPFPEGVPMGLVVFAGDVLPLQDLTTNYSIFLQKLDRVNPELFGNQGTNFEAAIKKTVSMFPEKPGMVKRIILISDGDVKESQQTDIGAAIDFAVGNGVVIDTIAVGFQKAPVPNYDGIGFLEDEDRETIFTEPDEKTLKKIADDTGGKPYRYQNSGELKGRLVEIFKNMKDKATKPVPVWRDGGFYIGTFGIFLFFLFLKEHLKFRIMDYLKLVKIN